MNLSGVLGILKRAKEAAHDAIAVIGGLTAAVGAVTLALDSLHINVTSAQVSAWLALAGGAAALLSKGIDSLNDALTPPAKP